MTANLEGATVGQALTAILKLGNLTARREDGMIYVYSAQDFKQVAFQNQEILTRVYRLNYIRATDMIQMIQELLSPEGTISATPPSREGINDSPSFSSTGSPSTGGGGGGAAGGGAGGGGIGTSGGNSMAGGDVVIVRDYFANLKAIDEIVTKLDVQPTQVLVEAVIVSVELTNTTQLGVNYAVVDKMGRALGTIGNGSDLVANSGFNPATLLTVPLTTTAAALAAAGRINGGTAQGGLSSPTDGIKFGYVSKNNAFFIRALETLGETKVLASPRLLVLNKQRAEIQLGQRLGYQTLTQNLTTSIQQVNFLNTGTLLRLRPFISTDGMVRMEIHPERSSGTVVNNLPSSNTSEVTTNVMVPDGATIIIGGLIEDTQDYSQQGLPGLHRIPALGALFGNKTRDRAKRELIILLTPHIWNQGPTPAECPTPPPSGTAAAKGPPARSLEPPVLPTSMSLKVPSTPVDGPRASTGVKAAPGGSRHVVLPGENFWTISRHYYRTGRYYLALWDANRDLAEAPELLRVGDEVRVPPLAELDRSLEVDPRTNQLMDGTPVPVAVASTSRRRSVGATDPDPSRAGRDAAPGTEPSPIRRSRISGN